MTIEIIDESDVKRTGDEEKDTLNFFLMIVVYYILLGLIMSRKMRWIIE